MAASLDDYRTSLRQFADRVPELLNRHGATARFGEQVAALNLGGQLDQANFTVALVGRMKSGKSTLLNALLGRALAPVGVNETTATVNWFDHGDGACEQEIEIFWKNRGRPPERRPLTAMDALLGSGVEAGIVDHVRFRVNAPFLKGVRLIDAPGTMSNLQSHEAATMDMITRQFGARADATVLVLPPVVSQADQKILQEFAGQTRLPGQGPYNTIAVYQKWENATDPEPEKAAWDLARNFKDRLRREVADVIPVSGLLAIFARCVSDDAVDRLAFLAAGLARPDLDSLLASESRFGKERDGMPLSGGERAALFAEVRASLLGAQAERAAGTYEMVRFALFYAHRRQITCPVALRRALHDVSNIDRLHDMLERRFRAMSGLIQAGSVIKKALDPCRLAVVSLGDELERRRASVAMGRAVLAETTGETAYDTRLREYLEASIPLLRAGMIPIESTLRELDTMIAAADLDFRLMVDDIASLNALGERHAVLPADLEEDARHLYGQYGFDTASRLRLPVTSSVREQHDAAAVLHQRFFEQRALSRVADHAATRLSLMLEELEKQLAG